MTGRERLDELDKLILELQDPRNRYPAEGYEFHSVVLELAEDGDDQYAKASVCEDDFEDSRGHGRACGRKRMYLYLESEKE